jgi:hypothetical protein
MELTFMHEPDDGQESGYRYYRSALGFYIELVHSSMRTPMEALWEATLQKPAASAVTSVAASAANAGGSQREGLLPQTVARSIRINAPVSIVWEAVRDFGAHGKWMPGAGHGAEHLTWTGNPTTPGTMRRFAAPGQPVFAEQLNRIDDEAAVLAYSIVESPLAITNHEATISVVADGDVAVASWTARFESDDEVATQLDGSMGSQNFEPGLAGLKAYAENL